MEPPFLPPPCSQAPLLLASVVCLLCDMQPISRFPCRWRIHPARIPALTASSPTPQPTCAMRCTKYRTVRIVRNFPAFSVVDTFTARLCLHIPPCLEHPPEPAPSSRCSLTGRTGEKRTRPAVWPCENASWHFRVWHGMSPPVESDPTQPPWRKPIGSDSHCCLQLSFVVKSSGGRIAAHLLAAGANRTDSPDSKSQPFRLRR